MEKDIEKQVVDSALMRWNGSKNKCQERIALANKKTSIMEIFQNKFIKELENNYGSSGIDAINAGDIISTIADYLSNNQYLLNVYELIDRDDSFKLEQEQKEAKVPTPHCRQAECISSDSQDKIRTNEILIKWYMGMVGKLSELLINDQKGN